jgi:hypothetical protein
MADRRAAPTGAPTRNGRRAALPPVRPRPAPPTASARNARRLDASRRTAVPRRDSAGARSGAGLSALPASFGRGTVAKDRTGETTADPNRANEPGTWRATVATGRATSTVTIRPTSASAKTERASGADEPSPIAEGRPPTGPVVRLAGGSPELGSGTCAWSEWFPERRRASLVLGSSGYVFHSSSGIRSRLLVCA